MLTVAALLAVLALLVWYQSTGVSTRQRWRGDGRVGQLAPEPPWPARPVDADERFGVLPRGRIVVPAVAAGVFAVAAVVLFVYGVEPLAMVTGALAALEAGAAVTAARHNREAIDFAAEKLLGRRPTGSGPSEDEP